MHWLVTCASGPHFAIRPHLGNVPKVRILVGINVDALFAEYHRKGQLFLPDADRALSDFRKSLKEDIQEAKYDMETEHGILAFVEDVASEKVEIKAHPSQNLHTKIYLFIPEPLMSTVQEQL